jgi:polyisoprenoid-binding protein YceI
MMAVVAVWSISLKGSATLSIDSPSTTTHAAEKNSEPAQTRYRIDPAQGKFMVKVFAGGLLSVLAHDHNIAIRDYSGTVDVTPTSLVPASLQLTIDSASLSVTDKVSDSDRQKIEKTMRDEVLEVGKYPQIVFKSTKIDVNKTGDGQYAAKIWGDLTLHGVTRNGLINATVRLVDNGVRATGSFNLKQSDYNIQRVSVAGGTIRVKDELKLTFDIVARS